MVLLTIVIFIVIFGLIVFVHELGHFLMAKRAGIGVEEFAFGFPPRVFARKIGETTYAINLIPLGGYVKMVGEDDESDDPKAFTRKSSFARAAVVVAGVLMNLLLAWIILTALIVVPARLKATNALFVASVQSGSAADNAGIRVGDLVLKINDQELTSPSQLREVTHQNAGRVVTVSIRRSGSEEQKRITLGQGDAPLGVGASSFSLSELPQESLWKAPWIALQMLGRVAWANFAFIGALILSLVGVGPHVAADQVSGPVGIYGIIAQFTALGWPYLLLGIAQLSLAVALFNILPIPALDGGRLLFIVIDGLFRRRLVSHKIEGIVHTIGFVLLLGLFAVVTWNDILKLIKK